MHTWESLSPSLAANFFLSGLLMYFCFWNIFSSPFLCMSENTALLSIPRRGFPLMLLKKENACGTGINGEPKKICIIFHFIWLKFFFGSRKTWVKGQSFSQLIRIQTTSLKILFFSQMSWIFIVSYGKYNSKPILYFLNRIRDMHIHATIFIEAHLNWRTGEFNEYHI